MHQLLCTEIFDNFLLSEAIITKDATFTIDGHINRDFYSAEDLEQLHLQNAKILPYGMLRNTCFDIIKGKHTPVSFKFILLLSPENMAQTIASSNSSLTPSDVNGMLLNLIYHNGQLTLTTGISYTTFSLDRTLEEAWDKMVQTFLYKHQISFEIL